MMTFPSPFIYLVVCGSHDPEYIPERKTWDMTWDRTVDDIASLQFTDIVRILEIGTNRDVTDHMLRIVADKWAAQGDPLSYAQYCFVEHHFGVAFAKKFALAEA